MRTSGGGYGRKPVEKTPRGSGRRPAAVVEIFVHRARHKQQYFRLFNSLSSTPLRALSPAVDDGGGGGGGGGGSGGHRDNTIMVDLFTVAPSVILVNFERRRRFSLDEQPAVDGSVELPARSASHTLSGSRDVRKTVTPNRSRRRYVSGCLGFADVSERRSPRTRGSRFARGCAGTGGTKPAPPPRNDTDARRDGTATARKS